MTAAGSQLQRWEIPGAIAASLLVQATISLLAAATPVLVPAIAAERGWNPSLITFYAPIICIASFLIAFRIPLLLQQLGGMGLSLAAVAVSVFGLAFLLLPSLWTLAMVPFGIGLANGAMNPASSQILGPRTTPRTAGLIMSIKQTGVPLGGVLAGLIIPLLVLQSGWQTATLELMSVSIALMLVFLPAVAWLNGARGSGPPTKYRPLDPLRRIVALPGMLRLLTAAMIFTGAQLCLRSFFTVYLVQEGGLDLATAGRAFSLSQAAGIVGQVGWAVLSDRVLSSHAVMAIVGGVIAAAALLTALITPDWSVTAVLVVAILFGGSAAGFVPVVLAEVARQSPAGQVGALTSGASLFLFSGVLLGPLVFGFVLSLLGYTAAFVTLAGFALAASAAAAATPRPHRQAANDD